MPEIKNLNSSSSGEPARDKGATLPQRLLLLFVCLALGLGAGFAGLHFTSDTAWFLAVPICMAIGWFLVADPTACIPERTPERVRRSGRKGG